MILKVDGDFLCYYQAHAMQSKGRKLESYTMQEFVQHALRTLNYVITKPLGNQVSHISFFFDEGKSWRYPFLDLHNIQYKDRDKTKRELVNFNDYRLFLRNTLAERKFAIVAIPGYEADDGIHISISQMDAGEICIFSGDSDLQQMLMSTETKEVFQYNPLIKDGAPIYRTVHQPQQAAQDDFFAEDVPTKQIETISPVKFVDPAEVLYIKMISGDSTDTIPSAFKYNDGKSDKTVGKDRAAGFHREQMPTPTKDDIRNYYLDRDARINLAQRIVSFAKLKALNKINDFEQGLRRNLKCIMLDDVVYEDHDLDTLRKRVVELMKPSPGAELGLIFRGTEFDFTTNYFRY